MEDIILLGCTLTITDEDLKYLSPTIKHIKFDSTPKITNKGLLNIKHECSIHLGYNINITQEGIKKNPYLYKKSSDVFHISFNRTKY